MATELLAIGTGVANSADVVVAVGDQLTVCLKAATAAALSPGAYVDIQLKDDAGQYFTVAGLTGEAPALVIAAAGTYRFSRHAPLSCGVFSG